jgi:hypothetical protein
MLDFLSLLKVLIIGSLIQAARSTHEYFRGFGSIVVLLLCFLSWGWLGAVVCFITAFIYQIVYMFYLESIIMDAYHKKLLGDADLE